MKKYILICMLSMMTQCMLAGKKVEVATGENTKTIYYFETDPSNAIAENIAVYKKQQKRRKESVDPEVLKQIRINTLEALADKKEVIVTYVRKEK